MFLTGTPIIVEGIPPFDNMILVASVVPKSATSKTRGILFFFAGIIKIMNIEDTVKMVSNVGFPAAAFFALMIIYGYYRRWRFKQGLRKR